MGKEESVKVTVAMSKEIYEQLGELREKKGKLSVPELVREAWQSILREKGRGGVRYEG